jgi:adenylate cyclase
VIRLAELAPCFEGVMPSAIASCAPDGTPNVTWLSIVHRVDDAHVALSFQFFNKTRANVSQNPRAMVLVSDPTTARQYRLEVVYIRTELEGTMFDRVRTQLDAVASQTGMNDVFRLRGLDVYRVLSVEKIAGDHDGDHGAELAAPDLGRLESFSARLSQMTDLASLVETALASLSSLFGYEHAFLLATAEDDASLFTLGSHGFDASGVGSDVRIGEGLIGVAAKSRLPVRITNMTRQLIYARAVREKETPSSASSTKEIALPGLARVESQLAMPLVAGGRLVGVLCLQSATAGRFAAVDEQVVAIIGRQLAAAMLALSVDTSVESDADPSAQDEPQRRPAAVRYFGADDSIFIDDVYLIKGVAGRVLWRLLSDFTTRGRADFSNKELRADRKLGLPGYRDNLEARLVLLRKRLEEQCEFIRLVSTGRGRFRLVVTRALALQSDADGD